MAKKGASKKSKRLRATEKEEDLAYAAGTGAIALPAAVLGGLLFGPPGAAVVLGAEVIGGTIARRQIKRSYPKTPAEIAEEDRIRREEAWL